MSFDFPKSTGVAGSNDWSVNDEIVWKGIICKFICEEGRKSFTIADLLSFDKISKMAGAYPSEEIRKAIYDKNNPFRVIINHCLQWFINKGFITVYGTTHNLAHETQYTATPRLSILCADILRYDLFVIDPIVNAEAIILQQKEYDKILGLLNYLQHNKINISQYVQVKSDTIHILNQIGVITISLRNELEISSLGSMVIKLLNQGSKKHR